MFRINRILQVSCCLGILALSQPALANYECVGTVNDVTVVPDGTLAIGTYADASTPDGWIYLCNMNNTVVNGGGSSISPVVCKSWQTTLVTAQVTNRNVRIWFEDSASCGSHTGFVVANVVFGPALEN
jgi:hypothetical protein